MQPEVDLGPDSWDDEAGAELYAEVAESGLIYRSLAAALVESLSPQRGESALDLACGTGVAAPLLSARLGAEGTIVGVDGSSAMLAVAARRMPASLATFLRGAADSIPLGAARFDLALCSAAFWHFARRHDTWSEIARVLRPRGRFAFNVPGAQIVGAPPRLPPPLTLALAREGERLFGAAPAPAGPLVEWRQLIDEALQHGFEIVEERWVEIRCSQAELRDLALIPAIGGRMYPERTERERDAWIDAAARTVQLDEVRSVDWWQLTLRLASVGDSK